MTLSDRALSFSIRAHTKKLKNDKPFVIHSLLVGLLLKTYGYDEQVVSAGFLCDIINNTSYTIEDISRLFGGSVASLLMTACMPQNDLSWKDDKKLEVKALSSLPERNMALICADKIITLEELSIEFRKNGKSDFSEYKQTKEELAWYYKTIYEKVSANLDSALVTRLHDAIHDVFDRDFYYDFSIEEDYKRLGRIAAYQEDLIKLKSIIGDTKPYMIEFIGTPKSGKSSVIRMFKEFFDGADFRVKVIEDSKPKNKYEDVLLRGNGISSLEKNLLIAAAIKDDLMNQIIGNQNVVMVESGLYDSLVLLKVLVNRGSISKESFDLYAKHYLPDIEFLINHVVISYILPEDVMRREVDSDILVPDLVNHMGMASEYNSALEDVKSLINGATIVDTTSIDAREATLRVADTLFPIMQKEYVYRLKRYLDDKIEV